MIPSSFCPIQAGHHSLFENTPCSDYPGKAPYQITCTLPPYSSLYLSLSRTFSEKHANNSPDSTNWVTSERALNDTCFLVFRLLSIYPQCTHTFCVWPPECRRSDGMCHFQGSAIRHCHFHFGCVYTVLLFYCLLWGKPVLMWWIAQNWSLLPRVM